MVVIFCLKSHIFVVRKQDEKGTKNLIIFPWVYPKQKNLKLLFFSFLVSYVFDIFFLFGGNFNFKLNQMNAIYHEEKRITSTLNQIS